MNAKSCCFIVCLLAAGCGDSRKSAPLGGSGGATQGSSGGSGGAESVPRVLVFSRTLGFRHAAIERGISAIEELGRERGFAVASSEDPARFEDTSLDSLAAVVFLCTSGDVLADPEQEAFRRFIQRGGGFVGVHSASDTEYDWPWYGELVGAYFRTHPTIQPAALVLENEAHPSTLGLPTRWMRTDEWYAFQTNPRPRVNVLLRLDESSYAPGDAGMGSDHPVAWFHEFDGGRAFYTALGHTEESYAEPEFRTHLAGAIEWAAHLR